jgi:cephalosporin hydroxylase
MSLTDAQNPELIARMAQDPSMREAAQRFFLKSCEYRYSYNFHWLGVSIIQYPQDILATQEIIWRTRPDVIIETGIAHGGSLIFYASMLELLGGAGRVIGVDVDIRAHNRRVIESHPMAKRITMIEGSSTDAATVARVREQIGPASRVMVALDSNHTHEHVLRELELYSPFVTRGCYLIVFDTVVDDMPKELLGDRPWGPGNNPKTAVHQFLKSNHRFRIDREIEAKLLMTVAPDGYLECLTDA